MVQMTEEYTLEMDEDYDLNLSVMTDELSTYNTTSVDNSNSFFHTTSEEGGSSKLSVSDSDQESETETPQLEPIKNQNSLQEKEDKTQESDSSPFLDVVVTSSFPILFSTFVKGALPGCSPFQSILSFTPFNPEKLHYLLRNIFAYYHSNERELLIFDDYLTNAFVDTFGNIGACIVDIENEIWL